MPSAKSIAARLASATLYGLSNLRSALETLRRAMADGQESARMYTSRKVRRAVQDMSDEEFALLLDDLDPQARGAVDGEAGRTDQALALTRHYDATRSLGTLVDLIREIAPNANL